MDASLNSIAITTTAYDGELFNVPMIIPVLLSLSHMIYSTEPEKLSPAPYFSGVLFACLHVFRSALLWLVLSFSHDCCI